MARITQRFSQVLRSSAPPGIDESSTIWHVFVNVRRYDIHLSLSLGVYTPFSNETRKMSRTTERNELYTREKREQTKRPCGDYEVKQSIPMRFVIAMEGAAISFTRRTLRPRPDPCSSLSLYPFRPPCCFPGPSLNKANADLVRLSFGRVPPI